MRIIKKFQGTVPENKILDTYSTSQTDTYSCNYINTTLNNIKSKMVEIYNNTSGATSGETVISYNQWKDYDLLLVIADESSLITSPRWFSGNLMYETWDAAYSKDLIYLRNTWYNSGDSSWHIGHCYSRGINGYTGYEQQDDKLVIRLIYGIKL